MIYDSSTGINCELCTCISLEVTYSILIKYYLSVKTNKLKSFEGQDIAEGESVAAGSKGLSNCSLESRTLAKS